MTASRRGMILVVSAPSGTGKSTLLKRLTAEFPNFAYSVSYTTRSPRAGEVQGKDYYFLGKDDFAAFNLHNREFVQLIVVFPKGKSAIDIDGLTEGEWVDRRMVKFTDAADIEWKANKLTKLVRAWVALVADKA